MSVIEDLLEINTSNYSLGNQFSDLFEEIQNLTNEVDNIQGWLSVAMSEIE